MSSLSSHVNLWPVISEVASRMRRTRRTRDAPSDEAMMMIMFYDTLMALPIKAFTAMIHCFCTLRCHAINVLPE